jgi:hypothetical protein
MSTGNHNIESTGAKPRDHEHPRHHYWKRAHKDWRLWIVVALMLTAILVYVCSDSLSLSPGHRARPQTPEISAP